jgi:hypothetical protein
MRNTIGLKRAAHARGDAAGTGGGARARPGRRTSSGSVISEMRAERDFSAACFEYDHGACATPGCLCCCHFMESKNG